MMAIVGVPVQRWMRLAFGQRKAWEVARAGPVPEGTGPTTGQPWQSPVPVSL
jgi:hypothetical protein